jgi:hypothetical protein
MWCVAGLIWTLLSSQTHHQQPGTGQASDSYWEHGVFQTCFGLSHGSNGLWLVKFISTVFYGSIRAMWCVVGLIWTLLPSQTHQQQPGPGQASDFYWEHGVFQTCFGLSHGSKNGLWLVKFISTVFYGSIRAMWCVVGLIWTLLPSQTHQQQPGPGQASDFYWEHGIFQTCFGLSHGFNGLWLVKLISISHL